MSREAFEKWKKDKGVHYNAAQAWQAAWGEQQKRIDELESKVTDLSKNLKDRELAVLVRQERIDDLESNLSATDTLSRMRAAVIGAYKTQGLDARTKRKMLILKKAEQKLKGGDE